ncbi:MAG TPA: M23 family metallopeptidase [Polyangiaceae bacterium]
MKTLSPFLAALVTFAAVSGGERGAEASVVWRSAPGAPPMPAFASPTAVGWADSWIMLDPLPHGLQTSVHEDALQPEASASDEPLDELESLVGAVTLLPEDDAPRLTIVGCELALTGGFTPETWSRELWLGGPWPIIVEGGHTDRDGRWIDYEQIARRPERPESYLAYRYPLADAPVVSGYDLDKPDDEQRRGRMNAVGHGGIDLVDKMGTPITVVRLEHQLGDAEVLYVGPLYGQTVVTRHVLREGGVKRDYVLIFGHLDRAADDLRRGRRLREGETLGFVGNTDSPALVHLHLEARRIRDGVDAWKLPGDALHAREFSVVTDPRNVLPLKGLRHRTPKCAPKIGVAPRRYWLGDAMTLSVDEDGGK